jgi:integrase
MEHRRRDPFEPADRADAGVEVELLAQGHVERPDAAADRRGERALDRHESLPHRVERGRREPVVDFGLGLLAREHFLPRDAATPANEPRKLPRVLSSEEIGSLLEAASEPKEKAMLSVAYGAGLRAMEVVALRVSDIDSKRMLLRVGNGKGGKDRYVMLSPTLLEALRDWYRIARPRVFLFPGRDKIGPMTTRQFHRICKGAAERAGLPKWVGPHTLRHSFATHLLENDLDVRVIQVLLGHAQLDTTARYTQVATNVIRRVMSPIDRLIPLDAPPPPPPDDPPPA